MAGTIGSGPDAAFAVTGDTVNTAARLQSAAAAGQTLVSPATESLTRHEFTFEPGGSLSLKGKAEPLPVFRLLGSRCSHPQALRGLAAHGLVAPLIGREEVLAQLLEAAHKVQGGRAQVVSLVAQAGIGKSRLLDALLERLGPLAPLEQAVVRRVVVRR